MIVWAAITGYLAVWLYAARWLFGHWRARMKDGNGWYGDIDTMPVLLGAFLLALIWPAVPVLYLMVRFVMSSPVLSQAEMKERVAERDRQIAELERQLGMR